MLNPVPPPLPKPPPLPESIPVLNYRPSRIDPARTNFLANCIWWFGGFVALLAISAIIFDATILTSIFVYKEWNDRNRFVPDLVTLFFGIICSTVLTLCAISLWRNSCQPVQQANAAAKSSEQSSGDVG